MVKNEITKNQIKKIIKNGGGNIAKNCRLKSFSSGYNVSIKDYYILNITDLKNIIKKSNEIIKTLTKNQVLGFWVNKNKLYIDISENVKSLVYAIFKGKLNNQLAIWDNTRQVVINL